MLEKKNLSQQILELTNLLPECCSSFLLETGTEMAYSTRLAYAHELKWFFEYLISFNAHFSIYENIKEISLVDIKIITSQDISRYLTIYKDNGKAERTIARKRASLSRFFTYLTDNKLIDYNPVLAATKVKIHQSDEVLYIDINEQNQFLHSVYYGNNLDNNKLKYHNKYRVRDYALVLLLLDTGMRVSELNSIDICDIDFENCSVIITRKGGNIQTVYFSNETADVLNEYLDERKIKNINFFDNAPLFTTLQGARLSIRAIEQLVKKYAQSSIPGKGSKLSPHKMRSSFAMEYYEETKDILALQKKLGHKNLAATNIYAKATDKKMKETRSVLSEKRKKYYEEE